jgi:hypothetical protein
MDKKDLPQDYCSCRCAAQPPSHVGGLLVEVMGIMGAPSCLFFFISPYYTITLSTINNNHFRGAELLAFSVHGSG